jgi:CPA1 family monovalent cation:H+ antiporter
MNGHILDAVAFLLCLAALFAYVNHYILKLPRNIGLLVIAAAASLLLSLIDRLDPSLGARAVLRGIVEQFDLPALFLNGMLGFLLYVGAVQVDLRSLARRKWTILALATVGVALATVLMADGMWAVFQLLAIPMPFAWCLVFGALTAPTDPVAVLDILRRIGLPSGLQAVIAGESLFNDGMGVVLFGLFLAAAQRANFDLEAASFMLDLLREAGGGALLGLATGGIALMAMRGIDDYAVESMISLALVTGTYGLAQNIGVSGPMAVVVAGLIMGSIGVTYAVSDEGHEYLRKFWNVIDQLLNATLFLLIGLQFAIISMEPRYLMAAVLAIPLALGVRAISVAVPGIPLNLDSPHKLRGIGLLTWVGLRGGVAVALALSLPATSERNALLTACYGIVIFTMVVQGLTLSRVAQKLFPRARSRPSPLDSVWRE